MGRASRAHPTGCRKVEAGRSNTQDLKILLGCSIPHLPRTCSRKVSVPECKVKSIRELVNPVTKKDLQSFLGTTGYYRKFIQDYSSRAHNLTEATKKAAPAKIMWSDDMYDAFLYLCRALSDCCMLHIPVSYDKFLLQTDASGRGIGAILSVIRDGEELPVSFFSKKLKPAETRYSATELECLAIIRAMEYLAVYFTSRSFTIQTDH